MASLSLSLTPPAPHRSPAFTPIPEENGEEEKEKSRSDEENTSSSKKKQQNQTPTPLHPSTKPSKSLHVDCNNCRPSTRDKISVVPLDINGQNSTNANHSSSPANPNGLLRSLLSSLTRRSPAAAAAGAEEWRRAAADLSGKLLHVTRKRDEALLEASRLKYSLAELDRKVDRLESHCRDLTAALDRSPSTAGFFSLDAFARAVADARAAVRQLGRSLTAQIRLVPPGPRFSDRVSALIQPFDPRAAAQWRRNPASGPVLFYLEALLNRVFYSEFESDEAVPGSGCVDPLVRCEMVRAELESVRELVWDDVLSKGTKHFSEGLSRFCDRKMSEVVTMMGWSRAWPEPLLESFFRAAKGTMVVRLMAKSVFPHVPMLRVDRTGRFDDRFMEDVAVDRVRNVVPTTVRLMVAPGFHVYMGGTRGVVKCKVLCAYSNCDNNVISN